jgi:threonine synthase
MRLPLSDGARDGERATRPGRSLAAGLSCFRCKKAIPQQDVATQLLCECGGPLLQNYDLGRLTKRDRESLRARPWGLWRYREVLPVMDSARIVSLSEGGTPLISLNATGAAVGVRKLVLKDEGRNPTGTFKARGASVAVSRLAELGLKALAMPTVGSGGSAWSAYGARAGLKVLVGLPSEGNLPVIASLEAGTYGAGVMKFAGHITEAFRDFRAYATHNGIPVVGAFLEPYRLEGEKTIGYEIAEEFHWRPPDWIVWPTGGAVGLVGLARAFRELRELHWLDGPAPGLIVVQVEGCSPLVDLMMGTGDGRSVARSESVAPGITVPGQPFRDLVLDIKNDFRVLGAAVADTDTLDTIAQVGADEGVLLSPEGAAGVAAVRMLRGSGAIREDASVVVVNTATGLRYPHLLETLQKRRSASPVAEGSFA